ncbi:flavodoxin family protein [Methanoplanus sp. FWC-SCC4]|uniref:Flavodoxin family protein n=1 Tax=Methanochimaera problematica TaxID=2609417 RepID=A0AA97FBM5_9EURY|nr:flavodoxin family protein [Methanoplanus sp. FWC-SCC4]WOF15229.1 flavodoxin family protein [Methanoplanus sp. FWC-SCC4]
MTISVVGFATSPRRHGNSEDLLDYVLGFMAKEEDVITEKIALSEYDVKPCRGCNSCEKNGICVIKDDVAGLLQKIIDADVVILSSPIYCMGLCSQAKALVDRTQVFRSRKYVLKIPVAPPERIGKRVGLFLSTAGQDWDFVFDGSIPAVKCFFHVSDIKDRDIEYLMINNVDEKGAIRAHKTAKSDAEEMAKKLIRKVRKLQE